MVRSVTPKASGFPGLPSWLDLPKIKAIKAEFNCSVKNARQILWDRDVLGYNKDVMTKGENNESRAAESVSIDRGTLPAQEAKPEE